MNGTNSSISDPYVQEFLLDSFSNVTIKPEIICPNQISDGNTLNDDAASTTVRTPSSASTVGGLPEDQLLLRHATPDSVVMSHPQIPHRLPSMSLLHAQTSPPPHLLTPPESQGDYYSQPSLHHHHQIMSSNMMKNCNPIIQGNLPDTPPINCSPPLPPAVYNHLEHHLQPQYPLHHLHPSPGEVAEDMLWLSQSSDLQPPRQEPLDLRPHCNGDSVQNWNMMQQHTSVITGAGKRIYHTDYIHHQTALGQCQPPWPLQALSPLLSNSSASSSASSSSSLSLSLTATSTKSLIANNGLDSQARSVDRRASTGSRTSTRGRVRIGCGANSNGISFNESILDEELPPNPDVKIDDDLLLKISVRDLNVKLKGTTKDQQSKTKQRRRTLKNRIYAQNCRNKRNVQKTELEIAKQHLEHEWRKEQAKSVTLQKEVARLQHDLGRERQMIHTLRNELDNLRNDAEILHQKLTEKVTRCASSNAPSRCSSANLVTNLSVTSSVGDY